MLAFCSYKILNYVHSYRKSVAMSISNLLYSLSNKNYNLFLNLIYCLYIQYIYLEDIMRKDILHKLQILAESAKYDV